MTKHIILVGMRGAGKTFFGKQLAQSLQLPFLDLDAYIQTQEKISIADMVKKYGWEYFRRKESQHLEKVLTKFPQCLCITGGGAVLAPENQALMKQFGKIIWIYTDIQDIIHYLKKAESSDHRPALTQKSFEEELKETYQEREPIYAHISDFKFLSNKNYSDQVQKLKESLEDEGK